MAMGLGASGEKEIGDPGGTSVRGDRSGAMERSVGCRKTVRRRARQKARRRCFKKSAGFRGQESPASDRSLRRWQDDFDGLRGIVVALQSELASERANRSAVEGRVSVVEKMAVAPPCAGPSSSTSSRAVVPEPSLALDGSPRLSWLTTSTGSAALRGVGM